MGWLEKFIDGVRQFDNATGGIMSALLTLLLVVAGALAIALLAVIAAVVVVLLVWLAAGVHGKILHKLWQKGVVARIVYFLVILPLFIAGVIRTEVGAVYAFVPLNIWVIIAIVTAINALFTWWHVVNHQYWFPKWIRSHRRALNDTVTGHGSLAEPTWTETYQPRVINPNLEPGKHYLLFWHKNGYWLAWRGKFQWIHKDFFVQ